MEQYIQAPASTESNLFELQVDHELSSSLNDISRWAKFVGIAGFIFAGLFFLAAFFIGKLFSSIMPFGSGMGAGGALVTIIYVILALLFFVPSLFVFNFGRKIQYAIRNNDQESLNSAFSNLKIRFKFVGIFYIVIFSIWVLSFLLGVLR